MPPSWNPRYETPQSLPEEITENRPDWLYEAFAERKIGARVVKELGIYATMKSYGDSPKLPSIVFPYRFQGDVLNRKYRTHPKQHMLQEKNAVPTLYNVDALGRTPEEIIWVEGEMDVAAMMECGFKHVVSLKDGAPEKAKIESDPDAKRFLALRTHEDMLNKAKRIILAGDMDAPGMALREELARRLGRHRCFKVTWPTDCKDAGDTLRLHGPDAVMVAYEEAEPYPVEGIQTIKPGMLLDLRNQPPPTVMTTGTSATDEILKLPDEGRLIVITGWPGSGKTTWSRYVMLHTMERHNRRWAVFSPEMQPWALFVTGCVETLSGKTFWPKSGWPTLSDEEIKKHSEWLTPRLTMVVCEAEREEPTLDWLLERIRIMVLRDGITDVLIDPWNEIEHARPMGQTETDYVGRSLQRLKAFALRHGCNMWIIVHPAKPPSLTKGEVRGAPGGYDISGSANWFNRADLGLTIHSPSPDTSELHIWKSRFVNRWGMRGKVATMNVDAITGRFSTPTAPFPDGPVAKPWNDPDD